MDAAQGWRVLGADLSRLHRKGRRQFHVLNLSGDDLGVSGLSQPRSVS